MGRKMALKSIERRQMRMPTEATKIVLRPRGGLTKLIQYGTAHLGDVIKAAAGIDPKEEGDDIFSPNFKQQSILVGTTCEKRKLKYACIKQIMLDGECVETSAYILGVRRLGKESKAVMLLFEENTVPRWILFGGVPLRCQLYKKKFEICTACGHLGHRDDVCPDPKNVRCRGCGLERPPKDHSCEPKCQLCGKGHILGDKKCREIFRTPYVVKKKQWERKQRQTDSSERQSRPRELKLEKGYKVRDKSFPRLDTRNPVEPRGRSGSRANSRGRSQSRGRSSSRGLANPRKRGWSQERKGVSFAKAVTQDKEDKRADEIDQLKKMVEKLSGIVESQKVEIQNLKKKQGPPTPPPPQPRPVAPEPPSSEGKMVTEATLPPPLKRKFQDADSGQTLEVRTLSSSSASSDWLKRPPGHKTSWPASKAVPPASPAWCRGGRENANSVGQ
ncbi:hypothetical protein HPB47_017857 [Ixodes persulcatus]|uniref:Uncharacterized protein n=1 Tax=Ixodes persulcatus TaxID=34615 RepID=A0AC60QM82_IXOPE|nr:hypothetical protein HPB47_017857 [Ixodes persulcatus]